MILCEAAFRPDSDCTHHRQEYALPTYQEPLKNCGVTSLDALEIPI